MREYNDSNFNVHGFLLSNGTIITFDVAGSPFTAAQGINPQGDIVGFYYDSSFNLHSFLLSKGGLPLLMYLRHLGAGRKRMGLTSKATSLAPTRTAAARRMVFC